MLIWFCLFKVARQVRNVGQEQCRCRTEAEFLWREVRPARCRNSRPKSCKNLHLMWLWDLKPWTSSLLIAVSLSHFVFLFLKVTLRSKVSSSKLPLQKLALDLDLNIKNKNFEFFLTWQKYDFISVHLCIISTGSNLNRNRKQKCKKFQHCDRNLLF